MESKPLTDLTNMSGDQAIEWILNNQFDYSLIRNEDINGQIEPSVIPASGNLKEELRKIIFSDEFGWVDNHEWMMDGDKATETLWNWFINNASRLSISKLKI